MKISIELQFNEQVILKNSEREIPDFNWGALTEDHMILLVQNNVM